MNTRILRWGGAALTIVVIGACSTGEAAEETPRLSTAEVRQGDLVITAEATGTVEPVRSVEVKSKASGEILKLHVDVGDSVAPGALLAEVDPRDVRNRFEQAKADLEVARSRTQISKAQLDRADELLKAGVITEEEHESRRLDYANAQASQVKAETNYELADLQLGDVTIKAPMKGTIIQKNVEEGGVIQSASQNVSGGTTLFVMANLDSMQVRTLVDETDIGEIHSGLSATVKVEAYPDRTFRGMVEKIEPQAEVQQNVTMFPVIVSLDNRGGLLKPGMNAEVEILVNQARNVLLVPNNAVVRPQDVGPAALALGIDPESLDLTQFVRAGRGANGARGGMQGQPGAQSAQGEAMAQAAPASRSSMAQRSDDGAVQRRAPGAQGAPAGVRSEIDSLRAKVARGEISQDSMRAAFQAMRAQAGGAAGDAAGDPPSGETRSAVVFVMGPDSVPTPKLVQVGLNDWDNTQVVSGLEGGETLVVVSAAQLQAQQQEWLNRIRSRMGGSPFGGGGPGRGR
jgi:HlyD family secretion protein